jgi:AraC family transcriptional regulator of adaptative response/methylated-DNA-[protein]-cysteine methyltransferase
MAGARKADSGKFWQLSTIRVAGRAAQRNVRATCSKRAVLMTQVQPYHYAIIARAIDNIASAAPDHISLEQVAAGVGLSPAHFQRVFSQWAGVSPKRFQQYLTLDHARRLLSERHSVMDAALDSGLSGSSRLHDLFLRWEAMSPGEYARGGEGLQISWGWFETPFGPALAMATERGLCGLAFAAETGRAAAMADMRARWPRASFEQAPERLDGWMNAAFGQGGEMRLHLIGAPFQIKVWEALMNVPSGHVATYSDLAAAVGRPKAMRAVGTAVGRNPVSWLIPCHRALQKAGGLGGYHWGPGVKRAMLAWESARFEAAG